MQNQPLKISATILVINEFLVDPIINNELKKEQVDKLPGSIMNYYEDVSVDLNYVLYTDNIKSIQKYLFRQINLLKPGEWFLYIGTDHETKG